MAKKIYPTKLKPCPFCGGKAQFKITSWDCCVDGTIFIHFVSQCAMCETSFGDKVYKFQYKHNINQDYGIVILKDDREKAEDDWNTRAEGR